MKKKLFAMFVLALGLCACGGGIDFRLMKANK